MATEVGTLQLKVDTSGVKSGESAVERFGDAAQDATAKTKSFSNQTRKSNVTVGDFGRKAGMAGIQVEQLAGQIAMGQNPMRALGVQAADLGFILGAPLLGAVVGIGAAIGSVLIPMLLSAGDSTEDLTDKMDELGLKFREMTQAQQYVFLIEFNKNLRELQSESEQARQKIEEIDEAIRRTQAGEMAFAPAISEQNKERARQQAIIDNNAIAIEKMTESLREETSAEKELRVEREKAQEQQARQAELDARLEEQRARQAENDLRRAEQFKTRVLSLNDTRIEAISRKEDELTTRLDEIRDQGLVSEQEYQRLLTEIQQQGQQQRFDLHTKEQELRMQQDQARLARLHEQNDEEMRSIIEADERKKESARETTSQLLGLEDTLLKGKSEKQKAGFRLAVNLASAEKRESARTIVSKSYEAAMKAYASLAGIPFIGPALGAAAAATILTAGVSYAAQSLSGRALGGQVRAGESYVVGERGPEVLTMGSGGRITPNDAIGGTVQPVSKTANVSFSIAANDSRGFDELLTQRRGLIMSMINEALNDSGREALV